MNKVRLTNPRISEATCPTGKTQAFIWDSDVQGLGVRIAAKGRKTFILERRLHGKTIRKTIGACSAWTIEDARKEARRLQTLIDQGIDPRELEREQHAEQARRKEATEAAKKEAEANKKYTLKALCDAYVGYLELRGKDKSARDVRSVFKVHLTEADPGLAGKPAREVTDRDVAGLIRRIAEKGKGRTAGILRSSMAAAYSCARRAPLDGNLPKAFIDFNIESNPVALTPSIPVNARERTLNQTELKKYIESLGDGLVDLALKLALYSGGQRMAQLLRAQTADWDASTKILRLTDPKGKRKQPREHLLPLAPVAASIVAELVQRAVGAGTQFLFFSMTKKTPIHVSVPGPRVTEIAAKIGLESFDLRDIRRTCETMLAKLKISRDIRAQLLSHGISGVQEKHYNQYDYIKEKRATLVKWERYLKRLSATRKKRRSSLLLRRRWKNNAIDEGLGSFPKAGISRPLPLLLP